MTSAGCGRSFEQRLWTFNCACGGNHES